MWEGRGRGGKGEGRGSGGEGTGREGTLPQYFIAPSSSFLEICLISIYFFFRPSLNSVLFPMFYLLVEGECQILVFKNFIG